MPDIAAIDGETGLGKGWFGAGGAAAWSTGWLKGGERPGLSLPYPSKGFSGAVVFFYPSASPGVRRAYLASVLTLTVGALAAALATGGL